MSSFSDEDTKAVHIMADLAKDYVNGVFMYSPEPPTCLDIAKDVYQRCSTVKDVCQRYNLLTRQQGTTECLMISMMSYAYCEGHKDRMKKTAETK